jgi:hypothetical protein
MINGAFIDRIHNALTAYRLAHAAEPREIAINERVADDDPKTMFGIPIFLDETLERGTFELREITTEERLQLDAENDAEREEVEL